MRFLFLLALGISLASCGGTSDSKSEDTTPTVSEIEKTDASSKPKSRVKPFQKKLKLTPFTQSQQFSDASIELVSFEDGEWNFDVKGSTYELGVQTSDVTSKGCANSAQGQHIHLIVDTDPYAAKYESNFKFDIADGKHAVLAFLSRSYHESIKTDNAYKANLMAIQDGALVRNTPLTDPMIFYSRPKGVYGGEDTKRVMLDYYLINTEADQYVRADINGQVFTLKEWQPYYIEGLPDGDNTITLSLLDKDGELVNNFNNPVSRTFKLNSTPQ